MIHRRDLITETGMETTPIKFYGDFQELEYAFITANKRDCDYTICGKTLDGKYIIINTLTIKNACIYDGKYHVSTLQIYDKDQQNHELIYRTEAGCYFMSQGLNCLNCKAIYKFILN